MPRLLYYVFGPIEHGNRVAIGLVDLDGVEAGVRLFKPWPRQAPRDEAVRLSRLSGPEKLHLLSSGSRFMLGPEVDAETLEFSR